MGVANVDRLDPEFNQDPVNPGDLSRLRRIHLD